MSGTLSRSCSAILKVTFLYNRFTYLQFMPIVVISHYYQTTIKKKNSMHLNTSNFAFTLKCFEASAFSLNSPTPPSSPPKRNSIGPRNCSCSPDRRLQRRGLGWSGAGSSPRDGNSGLPQTKPPPRGSARSSCREVVDAKEMMGT